MAKDFLAVAISGVGVERAFSQGRLVCRYLRNQLLPQTIKRLLVLRQHWGLLKKDRLQEEGERVKVAVADKESYTYRKKDFDVALKADISDDEDRGLTSSDGHDRATGKRSSARATRRKI
jgi:hypothetical protein